MILFSQMPLKTELLLLPSLEFGEFGLSCNSCMVLSDKFSLLTLLLHLRLPSVGFFNGRVGEDSVVILRQL